MLCFQKGSERVVAVDEMVEQYREPGEAGTEH
jgi:hypothetical protein